MSIINKINKVFFSFVLVFLMISLVPAGVTIETQPDAIYNLGDKVEFNIMVVPEGIFSDLVVLQLRCGQFETEIYKEYLFVEEEIVKKITVPLVKDFIGESIGSCSIFSDINGVESKISNDFSISNSLKFNVKSPTEKLEPGQSFIIEGTSYKENGEASGGVMEGRLKNEDSTDIYSVSEIISGSFTLEFTLPDGFKAGDHVINLYGYEKNLMGEITNFGNYIDTIVVRQVPTNLEVVVEEKKIVPGESIEAKVLLHDQSGEKIDSVTYVAIKDETGEIVQKLETKTDVLFEFPVNYTQAPGIWSIGAYSEELVNKINVEIIENKKIEFDLVNQTLIVMNKGNVPYIGEVNVTVGNSEIPLYVNLAVGGEEKYVLTAPDGEYEVKVGDLSERIPLTGRAIDVKKYTGNTGFNLSIVWIFLIFVLGFVAYTIFRKGYKRTFFGRVLKRKPKNNLENKNVLENSLGSKRVNNSKKVELSLSISGTKQNAVFGCISLKNYDEVKSGDGNVSETFDEIVSLVESKKGLVYDAKGNLFYIFAPAFTKTFKNESLALDASKEILKSLETHNKKFKKKIDFGIALNYGTIVTKVEPEAIKFMSMGTLMTMVKKMALASQGNLYMSEKVKDRLAAVIKTERKELGSTIFYEYKESIKKTDHSPFIKGFMERQQKERLAKENSKVQEKKE